MPETEEKFLIEFPESYQKVRRNYGIVASLLLFWEFLGMNLKTFGGENVNIIIDFPEAFPIVLVLLVLYFGFRLVLEWNYFGFVENQPKLFYKYGVTTQMPSVDYLISHLLGICSILIYFWQQYFDINLIEKLIFNNDVTILLVFISLSILILYSFLKLVPILKKEGKHFYKCNYFWVWVIALIIASSLFLLSIIYHVVLFNLLLIILITLTCVFFIGLYKLLAPLVKTIFNKPKD